MNIQWIFKDHPMIANEYSIHIQLFAMNIDWILNIHWIFIGCSMHIQLFQLVLHIHSISIEYSIIPNCHAMNIQLIWEVAAPNQ